MNEGWTTIQVRELNELRAQRDELYKTLCNAAPTLAAMRSVLKEFAPHRVADAWVRCNFGHEAPPIEEWNCPICVAEIVEQRDQLLEAAKIGLNYILSEEGSDKSDSHRVLSAIVHAEGQVQTQ